MFITNDVGFMDAKFTLVSGPGFFASPILRVPSDIGCFEVSYGVFFAKMAF